MSLHRKQKGAAYANRLAYLCTGALEAPQGRDLVGMPLVGTEAPDC